MWYRTSRRWNSKRSRGVDLGEELDPTESPTVGLLLDHRSSTLISPHDGSIRPSISGSDVQHARSFYSRECNDPPSSLLGQVPTQQPGSVSKSEIILRPGPSGSGDVARPSLTIKLTPQGRPAISADLQNNHSISPSPPCANLPPQDRSLYLDDWKPPVLLLEGRIHSPAVASGHRQIPEDIPPMYDEDGHYNHHRGWVGSQISAFRKARALGADSGRGGETTELVAPAN